MHREPGAWLLHPLVIFDVVVLVGAALAGATLADSPQRLFGEGDPITALSAAYLAGTAVLAWLLYRSRSRHRRPGDRSLVWLFVSAGFLFLAADDLFRVHERTDGAIHDWLDISETSLTDRIDDVLVALYGAAGLGLAVWGRSELARASAAGRYLVAGFGVFVVMVLIEFVLDASGTLDGWDDVLEDSAKIIAETLLFVGVAAALEASRRQGADTGCGHHAGGGGKER